MSGGRRTNRREKKGAEFAKVDLFDSQQLDNTSAATDFFDGQEFDEASAATDLFDTQRLDDEDRYATWRSATASASRRVPRATSSCGVHALGSSQAHVAPLCGEEARHPRVDAAALGARSKRSLSEADTPRTPCSAIRSFNALGHAQDAQRVRPRCRLS